MSNTIDVGALISSAVYIVPLIALMVSISTFTNASKERHAKTASEAAEIKAELRLLTNQVEELKSSYSEADDGYHQNATRITTLEQRVKALEARIKQVESELRNGR